MPRLGKRLACASPRWCACVIVWLLGTTWVQAQSDTISQRGTQIQWARAQGTSAIQLPTYNGLRYSLPSTRVEGFPWLFEALEAGAVSWRDHEIPAPRLWYDLVLDRAIAQADSLPARYIILSPQLVPAFQIQGRRFALPSALPSDDAPATLLTGYHEMAYQDSSLALLVKHRKVLHMQSGAAGGSWEYEDQTAKFVYRAGEYHRFAGNRSLLKALSPQRKALRTYLRQRKLRVRQASIPDLVPLFELYRSLES